MMEIGTGIAIFGVCMAFITVFLKIMSNKHHNPGNNKFVSKELCIALRDTIDTKLDGLHEKVDEIKDILNAEKSE